METASSAHTRVHGCVTPDGVHDYWQNWYPMKDGTGREYRQCRDCGMYQTRRD